MKVHKINEFEIIENEDDLLLVAGTEICRRLKYKQPETQASKIWNRHKDVLSKNSTVIKYRTQKGLRTLRVYNEVGALYFIAKCAKENNNSASSDLINAFSKTKEKNTEIKTEQELIKTTEITKPTRSLEALKEAVDHLVEQDKRIKNIEERLNQIENISKQAELELKRIPRSNNQPKDKSKRTKVLNLVTSYAEANHQEINVIWNNLYTQFKERYRFNVFTEYKNALKKDKKVTMLGIIEQNNLMDDLYDLASALF